MALHIDAGVVRVKAGAAGASVKERARVQAVLGVGLLQDDEMLGVTYVATTRGAVGGRSRGEGVHRRKRHDQIGSRIGSGC
jgi:hypothetical protein